MTITALLTSMLVNSVVVTEPDLTVPVRPTAPATRTAPEAALELPLWAPPRAVACEDAGLAHLGYDAIGPQRVALGLETPFGARRPTSTLFRFGAGEETTVLPKWDKRKASCASR